MTCPRRWPNSPIMLTLINTNRMTTPIAPLGVEYIAGAAAASGIEVNVVDLCLAGDPDGALRAGLAGSAPELVGLSFRNVDDCFWPSAESFVPVLARTVARVRELTDAPIVLGGVGYSIFPERIVERTGAEFGIRGDGERAIVELLGELRGGRQFDRVVGLVWRADGRVRSNGAAWPAELKPRSIRLS